MIGMFEDITRAGLLFSAKTFLAATIALWIALEFDLPRPYWALATVYILAQPLAGASRAEFGRRPRASLPRSGDLDRALPFSQQTGPLAT